MKEEVCIIPVSIPTTWFREKEVGKESMPLMHLSSAGLPLLHVKIRNVGFSLLMDTSVKHNLIDPYLMEWIEVPKPMDSAFWDTDSPPL